MFEHSEFLSHLDLGWWTRNPEGRAQAEMVLPPFAETQGPRLQGRNPASNKIPSCFRKFVNKEKSVRRILKIL